MTPADIAAAELRAGLSRRLAELGPRPARPGRPPPEPPCRPRPLPPGRRAQGRVSTVAGTAGRGARAPRPAAGCRARGRLGLVVPRLSRRDDRQRRVPRRPRLVRRRDALRALLDPRAPTASSSRRCSCRAGGSPTWSAGGGSSSAGLAGFTLGSLAVRGARRRWSCSSLARVLQAAGGALLVPAAQLLVMAAFPPEQRMKVVGAMAAVAALASALGPVLGGLAVELGGWRLVFLVNLPIGIAALAAGRRLPSPPTGRAARLPDMLGSVLAVAARRRARARRGAGAGLGLGRPARDRRVRRLRAAGRRCVLWRCARHAAPVLELALFRSRSFSAGNLGALLLGTSFFGLVLGNSLYLTQVWDYSVLQAGLAIAPGPLASAVAAVIAAALHRPDRPAAVPRPGRADQRGRGGAGWRRRSGRSATSSASGCRGSSRWASAWGSGSRRSSARACATSRPPSSASAAG